MTIFDDFKAVQRGFWSHFAPLQTFTTMPGAQLVKHARVPPGARLLDVACGTGVVAITAARAGATVTALDLTPALLEVGRANAQTAGVTVDFHEGDVEQLPFDNATFDVVTSQFGHMFAPRPDVALAEMLRVLRPGGTIAFSTWPPELFTGRMFAVVSRYLPPPPPGVVPPPLWGDPNVVRERLGSAVRDLVFTRGTLLAPALSVQHFRELTERTGGPVIKLVEHLSASDPGKLAQFRRDYDELTAEYFEDNHVRQDYLMTRAVKI